MTGNSQEEPDFFLSRAGPDAEVAKHVAHIIESSGKGVLIQDWDFKNHSFMERMHAALTSRVRVVALLSPDYLARDHCKAEWQNAIANDPLNRNGRLILLRIRPCAPSGLLESLAYVDLVPLLTDPHANLDLLRDVVLAAAQPGTDHRLPGDLSELFHPARVILHADIKETSSFTGREKILDRIGNALAAARRTAAPRPVIVHGLGGIGKSTLAREYAHRMRDFYSGLWWLNAEKSTPSGAWDGIEQGLIGLRKKLYPDVPEPRDRAEAARQVMNFLSATGTHKPWLLVYDNVSDDHLLRAWSPRCGVLVLATSRLGNWGPHVESIEVKAWQKETGASYLQRESTRSDLTRTDAENIADSLGCLPLALRHAATYLREVRNATADSYLKALSDHMKDVSDSSEYPRAVFATLMENARQAEMRALGAMAILSLASFYAPENIPEELFKQVADKYPKELAPIIGKPLACEKAFGALDRLSLIEFRTATRAFSVHRLVLAAARDALGSEAVGWASSALRVCSSASPGTGFENWTAFSRLLPHILTVATHAAHVGDDIGAPLALLLRQTANYLSERGAYAEAEPLYQRAIEIAEKTFGSGDPAIADLLVGLAHLHDLTGRIDEAESQLRRALKLYEKAQVPGGDPRITCAMNNLANIYHATGKYQRAEPIFLTAIRFDEKRHGPDHPVVATTLNNLASLYKDMHRFAEAEPLFKRVIDIGAKAYGAGHPDIAVWQNNLAELYRLTKRYELAEPLYHTVIATGEQALGRDHPDLAIWFANLALLYMETGRQEKAEPLLWRAIEIREKAMGRVDATAAQWLGSLASICVSTGRFTEAEPLFERAIAVCESDLAPSDPHVAALRLGLAVVYVKTGRNQAAVDLEARIQLPAH